MGGAMAERGRSEGGSREERERNEGGAREERGRSQGGAREVRGRSEGGASNTCETRLFHWWPGKGLRDCESLWPLCLSTLSSGGNNGGHGKASDWVRLISILVVAIEVRLISLVVVAIESIVSKLHQWKVPELGPSYFVLLRVGATSGKPPRPLKQ